MQFELHDFQQTASDQLLAEITKAQARYEADHEVLGAVVLEAATGAGKTVIATSVIEQLLFGSDSFTPNGPTAILWVTNDPSLNAQTDRKMQDASKRISGSIHIGQGATFNQETFDAGVIYFLNTQAANSSARIAKNGDGQDWTIWQTIANTVDKLGSNFIVFVDEAHYGVTDTNGNPTVVNKIANGPKPIPVFVGISATADRLNQALEEQGRFKKNVIVPIEQVRKSGLVKDRIVLAPSATRGEVTADTTFVRAGVQKTIDYERRWAAYAEAQGESPVRPALVIQVPDERSDDGSFLGLLGSVVDAVLQEWPGLIPRPDRAHVRRPRSDRSRRRPCYPVHATPGHSGCDRGARRAREERHHDGMGLSASGGARKPAEVRGADPRSRSSSAASFGNPSPAGSPPTRA